jgi:hypothetical protein
MSLQRFIAFAIFFSLTIHQQFRAQLTLEHIYTSDALIYSLGGTLTTQIQELDPTLNVLSNAFPNAIWPSSR